MAFIKNDFAKISSSLNNRVPRAWSYFTPTDSLFTVQFGAGYFNSIATEITAGDLIQVNATDGARLYQFSDITAGVVTVDNTTRNSTASYTSITTLGAGAEDHPVNMIQTGVINRVFLSPSFGVTLVGDYTFEFHDFSTGLLGTLVLTGSSGAGTLVHLQISPGIAVGQFQKLFWRKTASPAGVITLDSYVIIDVTQ